MDESTNKNIEPYNDLLTVRDVDALIERSLGSKVKVLSYSVTPYSDKILGFLSEQRKLMVQVHREDGRTKETHTYFLKCVPYTNESQAKCIRESKFFEKETNFYGSIIAELISHCNDKSWAAQCFLAKKDVLVFENLQTKSYVLKDNFLDVASLKAALSSMATMHAASMLAENQLGKSFLELHPHLLNEPPFGEKGPFAAWFQAGMNLSTALANKLGMDGGVVSKVYDLARTRTLPSTTRKNVLCHGDPNIRNLMFSADGKCALVDFQMFIYAPAVVDVAQLLYLNANKQVRDKCETELLRHYHQALCDALEASGADLPMFDDLLKEYSEMRVTGIVIANLYFPLDFLDSKLLAETVDNFEGSDGLFSQNHQEVVFKFMERDENYRHLMTSIVNELVDVSEIL